MTTQLKLCNSAPRLDYEGLRRAPDLRHITRVDWISEQPRNCGPPGSVESCFCVEEASGMCFHWVCGWHCWTALISLVQVWQVFGRPRLWLGPCSCSFPSRPSRVPASRSMREGTRLCRRTRAQCFFFFIWVCTLIENKYASWRYRFHAPLHR